MSTTQNIIALESQIPTKVSDLENDAGYITGDSGTQADWNETDKTAMGYIKNKPTIPAAVTIDATLTTQGAAADAKAVGDALRGGFTEWEFSGVPSGVSSLAMEFNTSEPICWILHFSYGDGLYSVYSLNDDAYATSVVFDMSDADQSGLQGTVTATRHLITPTKTSQLMNDGAPNGGGTPYATTTQIPDVTGKADKVANAAAGNLAALDAKGNLADSGVKPSDFAAKADLPYRLVEPGEWEFSGSGYDPSKTYEVVESGPAEVYYSYSLYEDGLVIAELYDYSTEHALSLEFTFGNNIQVTATRASLPGHLLDRAGNRVVVSGDTTLTLPAAVPGYLRDFLVRLEISGSTVPTIAFAAPTGETITYETDGDEFPVPDEAGTWSYSFTENCVAHKFAVSLKKVNEVAAPQAQGGS